MISTSQKTIRKIVYLSHWSNYRICLRIIDCLEKSITYEIEEVILKNLLIDWL